MNPDGRAKGGGVHFGLQEKLAGGILGGVWVFSLQFGSLCHMWAVFAGLICGIIGRGALAGGDSRGGGVVGNVSWIFAEDFYISRVLCTFGRNWPEFVWPEFVWPELAGVCLATVD